jgi:hypothetical protein
MHPAEWFDRTRDAFFEALLRVFTDPERGLPALLGHWVQDTLRAVWNALWDLFAPFNVFFQIPTWIVGQPFVETAWGILLPVAAVALGLAAVATLGLSMLSILGGRPPAVLFSGLRHFVRGTAGLLLGTRLYLTLIDVSNSLVARFLDPAGGLPGFDRLTAFGQAVTLPVLAVIYLVFACVFFVSRAKVVLTCIVCLILAPLAFVLGAMPFKKAQDAYDVWLTYAVASAFVQVVQAVFLGLGASILIHGTAGSGQSAPSEAMAAVVGILSIAAAGTMPTMLLGAMLNRALVPSGTLHRAADVSLQLASFALRMPVVPPVPASAYPPPTAPPTGRAFTAGHPPRQLIEYVPPMLPPPRP